MVVLFLCIEKVLNKGCKLPFFRAFYSFTGFFSKKYKITLKRRFMPRKTLGRRKECVGLFCQRQQKSPHGALVLALLSLYNALRRGSCQEYRGINSRLYDYFYVHFNFVYRRFIRYRIGIRMIFVVKEKALTIVRTRS